MHRHICRFLHAGLVIENKHEALWEVNACVCVCSTVRIWDYTQDACINVLSGHKAPVRGLMWNTELPYLLISGNGSKTAL